MTAPASLDELKDRAATASLFTDFSPAKQAVDSIPATAPSDGKPADHTDCAPSSGDIHHVTSGTYEPAETVQTFPRETEVRIAIRSPDPAGSRAREVGPQESQPLDVLGPSGRLTLLEMAFVDALLRSPTLDVRLAYDAAVAKVGKAPAVRDPAGAARALYGRPKVQTEIARRRKHIEAAVDAQTVQLETNLARQAFADLRELEDEDGQPRGLRHLPDDLAGALNGYEHEEVVRDMGEHGTETKITRKFKFVDKMAAQRELMRRRGLVKEAETGGGFVAHFHIDIGA